MFDGFEGGDSWGLGGDGPPLWVWIIGLFVMMLLVASVQSCS